MILTLALATSLSAAPISPDAPVHVGITLHFTHTAELEQTQTALQDPKSPQFRQWLTPAQFGQRFGQSEADYAAFARWLADGGLKVSTKPSRAFIEAWGTAAQMQRLFKTTLVRVEGQPASVHRALTRPQLPPQLDAMVVAIAGLDTRQHLKRRLNIGGGLITMGPQDIRHEYNMQPLLDQGYTGQGLRTAVLSTAEQPGQGASAVAIRWFFQNVSNARAPFVEDVMPNPQNDVDMSFGGGIEFDLDSEMHSVGVPGADAVILVEAPASEVFTSGAAHIANDLPDVAAVSISLGLCEAAEQAQVQQTGVNEINALRQAVIQGTMEGQTWSAASGDNGANDCQSGGGIGGASATVDFPADIPEMIAAGGSQINAPAFDAQNGIVTYVQEQTWNDGQGGAAGGGVSKVFGLPSYQSAAGFGTIHRMMPDIALIAGEPAVAIADSEPPGPLDPVEGTSVASPVSAGAFALMASRVGCRLGDIHSALYQLGVAQQHDGGVVFHDITVGNLTVGTVNGPNASVGYDTATGWGSLDVAALAAALPPCPLAPDAGTFDGGPAIAYDPCAFIGCDGGCHGIPEGPDTCLGSCAVGVAGSCAVGTVCTSGSIFSQGDAGVCVEGCASAVDCAASDAGPVCSLCAQTCVQQGNDTNKIGGQCQADTDCPSGEFCYSGRGFSSYCTLPCTQGVSAQDACSCPAGSTCGSIGAFQKTYLCLETCGYAGDPSCGRTDIVCQEQDAGSPVCLPPCQVLTFGGQTFDTCNFLGSDYACDLDSGICGGPVAPPPMDAGVDAGVDAGIDAGVQQDAGMMMMMTSDAGTGETPPKKSGCGCNAGGAMPLAFGFALLLLRRRQQR
ncbi:MAG: protease pro-enzyme activation domain-containing protein [Myxococcaceae bacterium]